jgi:predicted NBD/HSP70 family sugar kinase/DNA-binding CsgD family transcriptional regulator
MPIRNKKNKNENEKNILAKIRKHGPMTKYSLAEQLKISIPTVTTNVNKLIKEGFISDAGIADSEYGRKPILLDINYNKYFSIGIDIQNGYIFCCLLNLKFEVLFEEKYIYNKEAFVSELENIILNILNKNSIQKENIIGVGISYPGTVDENKLYLKTATNINLNNISLLELEKRLEINIYVGNEANLAAFGENIIGVSRMYSNSIYLSINEGIGGGIIMDKRYYTGSFYKSGEIGHMIIERNGKQCNCGKRGCAEAYVSIKTLVEEYNKLNIHHVTSLEELFKHYNNDDIKQKNVLEEYLEYLVISLDNLFLIFDPDCIILGGELSEYKKSIEYFIKSKIKDSGCKLLDKERKVLFSKLGYKASKIGAALIAMENVISLS